MTENETIQIQKDIEKTYRSWIDTLGKEVEDEMRENRLTHLKQWVVGNDIPLPLL